MEDHEGIIDFMPKVDSVYPTYVSETLYNFEHLKLVGYLRCLDCDSEFAIDQADSYMCRKVHQTVSRLSNKGWNDQDILKECKRIYGNDILLRHYEFNPPILVTAI